MALLVALALLPPLASEADTGGVAWYAPGWNWMNLCLAHESWGESVGCVDLPESAYYWCVKPGYIPGQWLTVEANGRAIACEVGDTVQPYDVDAWLSHNVIELSWEAYVALGKPSSASVSAYEPPAPDPEPDAPVEACFEETGHCVRMGFYTFWAANGGIPIFGLPLSDEVLEEGVPTQYFERAVFTWHPENPAPWTVLLRRVGADAYSTAPVSSEEVTP